MSANYLIILGLSSIALGIAWVVRDLEKPPSPLPFEQTRFMPDFVLVDFSTVSTNLQGTLKYQFQGQVLKHYPVIETEIERPYLVYYQNQQPTWFIWGEQGLIDSNLAWLKLTGESHFWHLNEKKQLVKIFSTDVLYKPQENYAETSAFTRLITHESNLTSIGMQLFFTTQQIILSNQVKGYYEKAY